LPLFAGETSAVAEGGYEEDEEDEEEGAE